MSRFLVTIRVAGRVVFDGPVASPSATSALTHALSLHGDVDPRNVVVKVRPM